MRYDAFYDRRLMDISYYSTAVEYRIEIISKISFKNLLAGVIEITKCRNVKFARNTPSRA